jgi:hypothetical protein
MSEFRHFCRCNPVTHCDCATILGRVPQWRRASVCDQARWPASVTLHLL